MIKLYKKTKSSIIATKPLTKKQFHDGEYYLLKIREGIIFK